MRRKREREANSVSITVRSFLKHFFDRKSFYGPQDNFEDDDDMHKLCNKQKQVKSTSRIEFLSQKHEIKTKTLK